MQRVHNLKQMKELRIKLRKGSTPLENIFWRKIREGGRYKFRRQHSIGKYIVDFYCPALKLIIEIDGDSHAEESARKNDVQREEYFRKLGFRIIRYQNRDILKNIDGVFEDLYKKISNPSQPPLS